MTAKGRPQITPRHIRRLSAEELKQRRGNVDSSHRFFNDSSLRHTRPRQDERHPQRRLIQEDSVSRLPVLPEPLPVIRKHGDHGVALPSRRAQGVEDPPELRVGECHLAVVGASRERLPVGRGRRVGRVRDRRSAPTRKRDPWCRASSPSRRTTASATSFAGRSAPCPMPGLGVKPLAEFVEPFAEAEGRGHRIRGHEARQCGSPHASGAMARPTCRRSRRNVTFSRTPCRGGRRPVSIVAWDGPRQGRRATRLRERGLRDGPAHPSRASGPARRP